MARTILITATVITLSISSGFVLFYLSTYKKRIIKKWDRVGHLSEIIIYPLKAGSGVLINEAYCAEEGLTECKNHQNFILGDRYFIAYEERSGLRISCKDCPVITKIKITSVDDTSVAISVPGYEDLHFTVPVGNVKKVDCMIYHDIPSETIDCGDEVARWMSNVIFQRNSGVRLGFYIRNKIRRRSDTAGMLKDYKKLYPEMRSHYLGAYSFLASYLLINQSSLDDLNARLPPGDGPVTSLSFRTNLTISGGKAYEEDNWKWIKIGENVILKNIKPCTRCLVVTLNPETAKFSPNYEPLKTLKMYRLQKDPERNRVEGWSPIFGQYFGLNEGGHIKIGDPVYVLDE